MNTHVKTFSLTPPANVAAQVAAGTQRALANRRFLGVALPAAEQPWRTQRGPGLLGQRAIMVCALTATAGPMAWMPAAQAAQAGAKLAVSVSVVANARLHSHHQADQLIISAADVSRGYVESPAASRFSVTTNSPAGYWVVFHPQIDLFESVHINGLAHAGQVGAEGGALVHRSAQPANGTHELSYRFVLKSGTEPGRFPWPLQLSVRALP